ncbi:MAG: SsrA-binding protein SmpB [Puniceicoccaceae bacterium]|nr:MAG: SsrA-binding protein SmpB [Puniceicoccaceae bacterium]
MSAKPSSHQRPLEFRNAKVRRDFIIGDRFEAGIVLRGTEVKSIRNGRVQLSDSFCRIEKGEVYVYNLHIDEYAFGNINNHPPLRPRKLLLKTREIAKIRHQMEAGGRAFIPLRIYFKQGLIKLELALCTGKKLFDKREDLKKRAALREVEKAMKFRR